MFKVTEAVREKLILAIALMGASGAGKTLSALLLAFGFMRAKYPELSDVDIWKKIGVVDTEHNRSKIHVGRTINGVKIGNFIHLDFDGDFTVERYGFAQAALKSKGCEIVIIDSGSHAWEGDGGLLDLQQKKGGNYQSWREVNPHYKKFIDIVTGVAHNMHTITCLRTKQEYAMTETGTGKLKVEKLGTKPVQRDNLEYEMQIVLHIDMDHRASATKDNSDIFEAPVQLSPAHGEKLYEWIEVGVDVRKQEEEERMKVIEEIAQMVTEYEELDERLNEMEQHPRINKPLDQFTLIEANRAKTALTKMKLQLDKNKPRFEKNSYFYHPESDSYVEFKKGQIIPPEIGQLNLITKKEYENGIKSQELANSNEDN